MFCFFTFYRYQLIELRIQRFIGVTEQHIKKKKDASSVEYQFTANALPPKRGNFYRLCDIKDDAMQKVIHSNDGKEKATCNVGDVYL